MKIDEKKLQALKQIKNMHVYQLENKNQYIIEADGVKCFQSYNSLIAVYDVADHTLLLGCDWDYSNTTRKHLYIFISDYCYLKDIDDVLYDCKNKRAAIYNMIKTGLIAYDSNMR